MDENLNKYKSFQAEDFAQDQLFIDWIQKRRPGLDHRWESWLREHPEKQAEVKQARQLVEMMRFEEQDPTDQQIGKMWGQIAEKLPKETRTYTTEAGKIFWQQTGWKIAASIALVLAVLYGINYKKNIETSFGETASYTLPDGSVVNLNAGSLLSYQPFNWKSERVLYLSGEAFFEVEKGKSFVVHTGQGMVEVLGTSFNVFAREGELTVKCFTGKVQVKGKDQTREEIIEPGEAVKLTGEKLVEFEFQPEADVDWRQGEFVFEEAPLERVLQELQRQYNVDLEINAKLDDRYYTGQFNNKSLEEALQMVLLPMSMEYEINKDKQLVIIR